MDKTVLLSFFYLLPLVTLALCPIILPLLENRFLILVFMDFQHRLWTDVESIIVISINYNIGYEKWCWNSLYNIDSSQNRCHLVRNIQKKCKNNISSTQTDVVRCITTSILAEPMLFYYDTTLVLVKIDVIWSITISIMLEPILFFHFLNILSILLILPKLILQIKNRTNPGITIYYIQIIIE